MTGHDSIWRRRLWVWLPALLFFLANAGAFSVYRLGYAGQVQSLEEDVEEQEQALAKLQAERRQLEGRLTSARLNRDRIRQLYDQRFSTRSRRLTSVDAEVKNLASQAGLSYESISYLENEIEQYGLVKRSFVFSVEGTYFELRRFINLLELSDSFLVLESVNLSESAREDEPELRINLQIATLFNRDPSEAGVVEVQPAAPRAAATQTTQGRGGVS